MTKQQAPEKAKEVKSATQYKCDGEWQNCVYYKKKFVQVDSCVTGDMASLLADLYKACSHKLKCFHKCPEAASVGRVTESLERTCKSFLAILSQGKD